MKNLSLILNVVLALAVVILYILFFNSSKNTGAEKNNSSQKKVQPVANKDGKNPALRLAYVNSDTLLLKYDFYKDTKRDLENKQRVIQSDLVNRRNALQNEVQSYQKTAYSMTQQQAAETERRLMQKEQELIKYGQTVEQGYLEQEKKLNEKLYNNIADYLKVYAEQNGYTYIFGYTRAGGSVLFADQAYEVTEEVIKGINEEYKNQQKAEKK